MAIENLITDLEQAKGPDKNLDASIALTMGYRRRVEKIQTSPTGEPVRRVLWIVPSGDEVLDVPPYTASLDCARELAEQISPQNVGGFSWEPGKGKAKLDEGPHCKAATPEIALCIAALKAMVARETIAVD